jgi:hypothetical protein
LNNKLVKNTEAASFSVKTRYCLYYLQFTPSILAGGLANFFTGWQGNPRS